MVAFNVRAITRRGGDGRWERVGRLRRGCQAQRPVLRLLVWVEGVWWRRPKERC